MSTEGRQEQAEKAGELRTPEFLKFLAAREVSKNITAATRDNYTSTLRSFESWMKERQITSVGQITVETMERYFSHLKTRHDLRAKNGDGRQASGESVFTHFARLRAVFRWLHARKQIEENPLRREDEGGAFVKKPGRRQKVAPKRELVEGVLKLFDPKNPPDFYRAEGMGEARARFLCLRNRALIALLAGLGMRASEALHLKTDEIAWKESQISFHAKGNRQDMTFLTPQIRAALWEYAEARGELARVEPDAAGRFFTTYDGGPMERNALRRLFQTLSHEMQTHISPHSLRYFAAVSFYRRTKDLAMTQRFLRHSSPVTTARYLGFDLEDVRNSVTTNSPVEGML
jgi:site-specific recombinase XerD